jgi:succinate dehydrogenase / fumarate reductase flavoprotein subunit
VAPFDRAAGDSERENPYQIQLDLQDVMQSLVGIIRTEHELTEALKEIESLRERAQRVVVEGHRQYNPGWHLAIDLNSLLLVSECIATAALARKESRGGHTRDDYPKPDPEFGKVNHVLRLRDGRIDLTAEPLPELPAELAALFDAPAAAQQQEKAAQEKAAESITGRIPTASSADGASDRAAAGGDAAYPPAPADPTVSQKEGA